MNIGPFVLDGDHTDEHVAVVRDALQVDAPWWVHLAESSGHLKLTVRAHVRQGRYWRSGRIHFPTSPAYMAAWLLHECGHSADKLLLERNPDVKRQVHALMHSDTPDCGHGWSTTSEVPWDERPTEAFGEWWAYRWAGRGDGRTGPHRHDGDVSKQIEELVMGQAGEPFTDIEDSAHRDAIRWAAGQGLVGGYGDGTFRPDEPVTRGQLATILRAQHGGDDG